MDETMEALGAISQIVVRCHLLLYVSCIQDHDFQLNLITLLIKHVSTADGPWQSDWCKIRPGAGAGESGLDWCGLGGVQVGLFAPPMKRTRFVSLKVKVSGALAQQ